MGRQNRYLVLAILLLIIGCNDDFLPEGIYGYQVENLLSGLSVKEWVDQSSQSECEDLPIKLRISLTNSMDSIEIAELIPDCGSQSYDTLILGKANASENNLIFTDSLNFEDGSYWIMNKIRSDKVQIDRNGAFFSYFSITD